MENFLLKNDEFPLKNGRLFCIWGTCFFPGSHRAVGRFFEQHPEQVWILSWKCWTVHWKWWISYETMTDFIPFILQCSSRAATSRGVLATVLATRKICTSTEAAASTSVSSASFDSNARISNRKHEWRSGRYNRNLQFAATIEQWRWIFVEHDNFESDESNNDDFYTVATMKAGSVCFAHGYMVHTTTPNINPESIRLGVFMRWHFTDMTAKWKDSEHARDMVRFVCI